MSATRELANYLASFDPDDLPENVLERAKLLTTDALGNAIGGLPFELSRTFTDLARHVGGGSADASILGGRGKASVPWATFANTALSTMLDYSDYMFSESGRCPIWVGPLAVPAALAAGEKATISGREFLASVAAGYECAARVLRSMDMSVERMLEVNGETLSTFAAVGAAGRALKLTPDQMLSALAMAGIYTPVPAYYKWIGDEGLTPRKDIKQGWAWMAMTGAFAAVSAEHGLKALQRNNILDGERGLSRMLGMDQFDEQKITRDLGKRYYIEEFGTKAYPGCAFTFTAIEGAVDMVQHEKLRSSDIVRIDVETNWSNATGFDDRVTESIQDRQFNFPYQIAAALVAGERGPNWYTETTAQDQELARLKEVVHVAFDQECEDFYRQTGKWMSKIRVTTRDGRSCNAKVEEVPTLTEAADIRAKFLRTCSQVVGRARAERILSTIDSIHEADRLTQLVTELDVRPQGEAQEQVA